MTTANYKGYNSPFAKRLRYLIDVNGTKHSELASKDVLNVSRQSIGQYCNGASFPPADKIVILAQFFNVSTDYLLGLTDVKSTDADLKSICEYTGLSEESIKMLSGECDYFLSYLQEYTYLINQIITSEYGKGVLFLLIKFLRTCKNKAMLYQKHKPIIDRLESLDNITLDITDEYSRETLYDIKDYFFELDVNSPTIFLRVSRAFESFVASISYEISKNSDDSLFRINIPNVEPLRHEIFDGLYIGKLLSTLSGTGSATIHHERSVDDGKHKED